MINPRLRQHFFDGRCGAGLRSFTPKQVQMIVDELGEPWPFASRQIKDALEKIRSCSTLLRKRHPFGDAERFRAWRYVLQGAKIRSSPYRATSSLVRMPVQAIPSSAVKSIFVSWQTFARQLSDVSLSAVKSWRKDFSGCLTHINTNNSQVSEQREPSSSLEWPSRDETQLLLNLGTNLRFIFHIPS